MPEEEVTDSLWKGADERRVSREGNIYTGS